MSIITKIQDKKFQGTMISVVLVFLLLYEGISVMLYLSVDATNYVGIISLPSSMLCIVMIPLLFAAWKVTKGAKIHVPENNNTTKFKFKQEPQQQPPFLQVNPQPILGTWSCRCGNLAMGDFCNKCGRNKS